MFSLCKRFGKQREFKESTSIIRYGLKRTIEWYKDKNNTFTNTMLWWYRWTTEKVRDDLLWRHVHLSLTISSNCWISAVILDICWEMPLQRLKKVTYGLRFSEIFASQNRVRVAVQEIHRILILTWRTNTTESFGGVSWTYTALWKDG